jgi:short-subunit dehydrogenase
VRGKNVLITGGSRGLGLQIARTLIGKGAHVALVARDEAELGRAIDELLSHAGTATRVIGVPCDLASHAAVDSMVEQVQSALGPIDVLINNAGAIEVGPLDSMRFEDFEHAMQIHCFAPLRTMLRVRDSMRDRGGGRIVNITSIGGLVSVPHLVPYCTSKFALRGLSLGMRAELARDKIVVSTIAPGLMRTGSPGRARFKGAHRAEYAWFAIADSLPLLSVGAHGAARRIVRALEYGEPHVVIGVPTKMVAIAQGLAPGLVSRAMEIANALLPHGTAQQSHLGFESESALAPSILTTLTEQAATENNQR